MPGIICHQDNAQLLRPLPLTDEELESEYTSPACLEPPVSPMSEPAPVWHGKGTTYVPGLESLTKLYCVWHEAQAVSWVTLQGPDAALQHYQDRIQGIIDSLPRELRWRGGLSRPHYVTQGHESQTVNIYITSLHLRSNLLQKRGRPAVDALEHQQIVDDLLEILYQLSPPIFYANGLSMMPKIRDIGATYQEAMQVSADGAPDVLDRMDRLSRRLCVLDCWLGIPQPRCS